MEEGRDIDQLLEADLDELDDEHLDDEHIDVGPLLAHRDWEQPDDYDEIQKEFLSGSQKIFTGGDSAFSLLSFRLSDLGSLSNSSVTPITPDGLLESPDQHENKNCLGNMSSYTCISTMEAESPEATEERRNLVSQVLALMIDSIEALSEVFARPAASFAPKPVDLSALIPPLLVHGGIEEDIDDVVLPPPASARLVTERIDMLVKEAERIKKQQQLDANEAEEVIRAAYEREQERLEHDRRQRQERAQRREDARLAALKETAAMRVQRVFRGHRARVVARGLLLAHRALAEARRQEAERIQREDAQREERARAQMEEERQERERMEQLRLEQERLERERLEEEARSEHNRLEQQRLDQQRQEQARMEQARMEQARMEQARMEQARMEQAQLEAEERAEALRKADLARISMERREREELERQQRERVAVAEQAAKKVVMTPQRGETAKAAVRKGAPPLPAGAQPLENTWGGVFSTAAWATPAVDGTSAAEDGIAQVEAPPYVYAEDEGIPDDLEYETEYDSSDDNGTALSPWQVRAPAAPELSGPLSLLTCLPLPPLSLLAAPVVHSVAFAAQPTETLSFADVLTLPHAHPARCVKPFADALLEGWAAWCSLYDSIIPAETHQTYALLSTAPSSAEELKEVEYTVEDVTSLDSVFQRFGALVQKLTLNVNRLTSLVGIAQFVHLRHLFVCDNLLTALSDELPKLPFLQSLYVDSNRLQTLSCRHAELHTLSATCNLLSAFPQLDCPQLVKLDLYQNKLRELSGAALDAHPRLLHLNLGRNELAFVDGRTLSRCVFLQTLVLSQNKLLALPAPLMLPCLQALWINGNQLADASPWRADPERPVFLPCLQRLFLQDNQLSVFPLDALSLLPSLHELDLSFNQVPFEGLQGLVELDYDHPLRRGLANLKINDNPLTSAQPRRAYLQSLQQPQTATQAFRRSPNEVYTQHARAAWENSDWKGLVLSTLPGIKLLCGEDARKGADSIYCAISTLPEAECRAWARSRDLDCLLQQCGSLRAVGEVVQHKVRKRGLKQDLDLTLLELSIQHCRQLRGLHGQTHARVLCAYADFREASALISGPTTAPPTALASSPAPLPFSASDPPLGPGPHLAAARIQSWCRGYLARRRFSSCMRHIRYEDDELDDILNATDADLHFDMGDFDLDDFDAAPGKEPSRSASQAGEKTVGKALAYGDHVRLRRSRENVPPPQAWTGSTLADLPAYGLLPIQAGVLEAPLSARTTHSSQSVPSRPQSTASNFSVLTDHSQPADAFGQTPRSAGAKQHIQEEWGIQDPKLLQAILKRNKRMKHFMHAAENREKDKSAAVRYERFVRSNNSHAGAHPHAKNPATKRAGPSGKAPPAWMLNPDL